MLDSVRTRLTIWYVGVLALVLIAFSLSVYTLLARSLSDRLDSSLRAVVEAATISLKREIEEGEDKQQAAVSTVTELFFPRQALAIFDAEGQLLAENPLQDNTHARLPALNLIPDHDIYLSTTPEDAKDAPKDDAKDDDGYRVAIQRVSIAPAGLTYLIVVSQPMEAVLEELELLQRIFLIAVPTALALAGLGGWFLARQSLAPVVTMSEQAHRIGAENLDQRLPVVNPRDELGHLATTFNALLARLNAAFARQQQFMTDASHELRTPLSVIHTAAGVTLEREHRAEDEYRDALKVIDEQTRRLTRIVEDMFTLTRADAGSHPLRQTKFYLDELLAEAARAAAVLAAHKGVIIDVASSSETPYYGDEDLLRRMILNLLDNAIKHTPPGGVIRVRLERQEAKYLITIADTGTGIPAEAQPHIFERFYRADKARARAETDNGSGAGLGLAIARWIAEAHEGRLELAHSDSTGSTFVAALPALNHL